MNPFMERVFGFLLALRWPFLVPVNEVTDDLIVLASGRHLHMNCRISALEDEPYLLAEVQYEIRVPAALVPDVAEYVERANALTPISKLIFERDTGILAFQHYLDTDCRPLTVARFRRFVEYTVTQADEHYPALMGVMFGGLPPLDALGLVIRLPVDAVVRRASNDLM